MSSYSYCQHPGCDAGLDATTISEMVYGGQCCAYGHDNPPNRTLAEACLELEERIEGLEESLKSLASVVSELRRA